MWETDCCLWDSSMYCTIVRSSSAIVVREKRSREGYMGRGREKRRLGGEEGVFFFFLLWLLPIWGVKREKKSEEEEVPFWEWGQGGGGWKWEQTCPRKSRGGGHRIDIFLSLLSFLLQSFFLRWFWPIQLTSRLIFSGLLFQTWFLVLLAV